MAAAREVKDGASVHHAYQGLCPKYSDCGEHCVAVGYVKGGKCMSPQLGVLEVACYCFY